MYIVGWDVGWVDGWEYEDKLSYLTRGMFRASRLDGVRLYPYRWIGYTRFYIGEDEE